MNKHSRALWIIFAVLMFFRIATDMDTGMLLKLISCVLPAVLLKKIGMPSKKNVFLSVLFAVLSVVAYLGYQLSPGILIYGLTAGIPTLLSSLAVFSVMEKQGGYDLISKRGKHPVLLSVGIALLTGIILAVINTFLAAASGDEIRPEFSFRYVLLSLNPAIYEEMAFRAVFMAWCVFFSRGREMTAAETFTMYFMMCVPHTVIHGYGLTETVILCLFFGMPFTFLQRKRDIMSAMISHGFVDVIRFTLTGI